MPKVTVIMPSLNVIKYIKPCMDSVLAQTLSDIEILAIDAGSTDGTLEILQEYADADDRVKVVVSEKKSYGYQVNLGLEQAQGDYIGIVETDDKIVPDMYERLYRLAENVEADYVKGRAELYVNKGEDKVWSSPIFSPLQDAKLFGQVIAPCERPELLIYDIYLWTGIYKKDFLQEIRLNETPGAAFQDQGFLLQTISRAKRAVYLDYIVYSYRQDNVNSSIYNQKGFRYLVEEYGLNKKWLEELNVQWTKSFYQRMFNQSKARFETMAVSSFFWEEAMPDMEVLRCRLYEAVEQNVLQKADMDTEQWELLQLWFQDSRLVYERCRERLADRTSNMKDIWSKVKGRTVIICGCGKRGKFLHILLEHRCRGIVQGFADNDADKWNKSVQGLEVIAPAEAVGKYPDAVYVIANRNYAEQIEEQLRQLGLKDRQVCRFFAGLNLELLRIPLED